MPCDVLLELSGNLEVSSEGLSQVQHAAEATPAGETLYILLPSTSFDQHYLNASESFHAVSQCISALYNTASVTFWQRNTRLTSVQVILELLNPDKAREVRKRKDWRQVWQEADIDGDKGKERQRKGLYGTVVLGGTFDHLHAGHKVLLTMAVWLAQDRLIVGITDECLLQRKKFKQHLQSLPDRLESTRTFLRSIAPASLELQLVPIQDIYGPTASDASCDAIVCSVETASGAQSVNSKRAELGFNQLDVFQVDVVVPLKVQGNISKRIEMKMGSTGIREWLATQTSETVGGSEM